jgi:hypothetical protein
LEPAQLWISYSFGISGIKVSLYSPKRSKCQDKKERGKKKSYCLELLSESLIVGGHKMVGMGWSWSTNGGYWGQPKNFFNCSNIKKIPFSLVEFNFEHLPPKKMSSPLCHNYISIHNTESSIEKCHPKLWWTSLAIVEARSKPSNFCKGKEVSQSWVATWAFENQKFFNWVVNLYHSLGMLRRNETQNGWMKNWTIKLLKGSNQYWCDIENYLVINPGPGIR